MSDRRLVSIDALRGVAALAVVLSHTVEKINYLNISSPPPPPPDFHWIGPVLDRIFSYGRVGVTLFFLISGFCIHLRWARAQVGGESTRIDFASFYRKRFIRLYPPFLVAMGFYLAVQTVNGSMSWNRFDVFDVLSHVLMVHNFDERTIFSIDGVFWTLAIEEQLYLAYFLLLRMRERWGWRTTILICLGGRIAWFALAFAINRVGGEFRLPHEGGSLANWFVWALGALSIEAAVGLVRLPAWASRASSALACIAVAIACDLVSEYHLFGDIGWRLTWLIASPVWGLGFFVMVNRLVASEARWGTRGVVPRLVALLAWMGLFSYSTYLMHHFVLLYIDPILFRSIGIANSLGNKLLFLPLCLAFCWGFSVVFEKPFIAKKVRREPVPPSTANSPAYARRVSTADPR